jgi:hypothetical protein
MEEKDIENRIVEIVSHSGKSVGNIYLLTELKRTLKGIDDDTYWRVRNKLIDEGKLGKGRGKGGSVYLLKITGGENTDSEKGKKKRVLEKELYLPFYEVITDFWVKDKGFDIQLSEITANQGRRKTGGRWTRPDITLIAFKSYQFVAGKTMDVITFEIKPEDNFGVESVFETAAQSVFAHKSYLCIHLPQGKPDTEPFEKIQSQCENFGVGLIVFEKPEVWGTYETIVEPIRRNPDPYEVNLFITQQLNEQTKADLAKNLRS